MTEATGNMAQVSPEEAGEKPQKKTKKASKAKAAKPEPEKAKAAEPEPEKVAAPEAEPTTNGANKIDELEPQAIPAVEEAAAPTTEREINEKIQKERQEQTQKMFGGQVEEATLAGGPRFIEASIFPDAYCPLCGQKLSGNSKTGFKQAFYLHPFTPSITLGKPCELKGKRLRAPTARMEIVD
ncbi:MAG: hypothetical protein V3T35_09505 [Spirochaetia bacterium]